MEERLSFQQVVWESWTAARKSMKLEHTLTLHKIIHDTIKLLKENIGKTFLYINQCNIFLVSQGKINKNQSK